MVIRDLNPKSKIKKSKIKKAPLGITLREAIPKTDYILIEISRHNLRGQERRETNIKIGRDWLNVMAGRSRESEKKRAKEKTGSCSEGTIICWLVYVSQIIKNDGSKVKPNPGSPIPVQR